MTYEWDMIHRIGVQFLCSSEQSEHLNSPKNRTPSTSTKIVVGEWDNRIMPSQIDP